MKYFKYIKYILKHKYYVFIECCRLGIPFRGLMHDMHKLLPSEFIPYAKFFYGNYEEKDHTQVHGDARNFIDEKKTKKYIEEQFDLAWLKHQHRGKHHWQYWILKEDSGDMIAINMPIKYKKEMLADWIGAGKAIHNKDDTKAWYHANKDKMILHPATKYWIEHQLSNR